MARPRKFDKLQVTENAIVLFGRRGYGRTTIAELGEATGLYAPSIYAAFGSKQGLFNAALSIFRDRELQRIIKATREPSICAVVSRFLLDHPTMSGNLPHGRFYIRLLNDIDDPEISHNIVQLLTSVDNALTERFEQAVTDGELPATSNPHELALDLRSTLDGILLRAAAGQNSEQIAAMARRFAEARRLPHADQSTPEPTATTPLLTEGKSKASTRSPSPHIIAPFLSKSVEIPPNEKHEALPPRLISLLSRQGKSSANSIIRAAAELFAKKGVNAVSLREIAESANVNYGLIHHYFKTKEALLLSITGAFAEYGRDLISEDLNAHQITEQFFYANSGGFPKIFSWAVSDGTDPEAVFVDTTSQQDYSTAIERYWRDQPPYSRPALFDPRVVAAVSMLIVMMWNTYAPYMKALGAINDRSLESMQPEVLEVVKVMIRSTGAAFRS